MTAYELIELNSKLQFYCRCVASLLHNQNYFSGMHYVQILRADLQEFIEVIYSEANIINEDSKALFLQSLQTLVQAQEQEDYVLLADVLELQLLPDLNNISLNLQTCMNIDNETSKIWENNLKELKKKDVELTRLAEQRYIKMQNRENNGSVWLESTNCGMKTLVGRDEKGTFYFHSNTDPFFEAWQFANWYYKPEKRQYQIYGLGLGYHVEALTDMDESISIRVYEQDMDVIVSFLCNRDVTNVMNNQNIKIIYDPDMRLFAEDMNEGSVIVIHHPSLRHVKQKNIRERMEYMFIRDSGIRNQHNLMVSNFRENELKCVHNVDELRDGFMGKKAIIVAAGPSLDKNIKLLKQKPKECLIVSTGTVFHRLVQMGVEIDYVIVCDSKNGIRNQICRDLDNQTPILVLSTASKSVASEYAGKKYIIYQKDYPLSEECAKVKHCDTYETGGSVSTTALDVCLRLGCRSVAYIGLDLAYTGKRGHATGTQGLKEIDISGMRMVPGYDIIWKDNNYVIDKQEVATSHLFDMYRQWIENRVQKTKTPVFDATEGGSFVAGLEIIALKEYLEMT